MGVSRLYGLGLSNLYSYELFRGITLWKVFTAFLFFIISVKDCWCSSPMTRYLRRIDSTISENIFQSMSHRHFFVPWPCKSVLYPISLGTVQWYWYTHFFSFLDHVTFLYRTSIEAMIFFRSLTMCDVRWHRYVYTHFFSRSLETVRVFKKKKKHVDFYQTLQKKCNFSVLVFLVITLLMELYQNY